MRNEALRPGPLLGALALAALAGACDDGAQQQADADAAADAAVDAGPEAICDIDVQRIYDQVADLCADSRGGRKPGTPDGIDALHAVEQAFEQAGLTDYTGVEGTDDYTQQFEYEEWSNRDSSLMIDGSGFNEWSDYSVFAYCGSGQVTSSLAYVGYGITIPPFDPAEYPDCPLDPAVGYDDYAGIDVTGQTVLVLRHGPADSEAIYQGCPNNEACVAGTEPCSWLFGYKAANAALHGAGAMLLVQHYAESPYIMTAATLGEEYYQAEFPSLFVNRDKIEFALPDLESWTAQIDDTLAPNSTLATDVVVELDVDVGFETIQTDNLIGLLRGSDEALADEVILISANIDSLGVDPKTDIVYNGADANASGIAVMLALARHFAIHPPARSLLFAAWNARDAGLLGSSYYVQHPLVPLADIRAMVNLDMVGAGDASGVRIVGGVDPDNAWIAELFEGTSAAAGYDLAVVPEIQPEEPGADDYPFAASGVDAVTVTTLGDHWLHHTPDDTIDTIDPADLEAAACQTRAALEALAAGEEAAYVGKGGALPDEPAAYWVFFTDKGVAPSGLARELDRRQAELAPAALSRRRRVRGDRGVDRRDLPVHAAYIDQLRATGAELRTTSRWLDAASVTATGAQRAAIAALPFVDRVRPVARRLPREVPVPVPEPPDKGGGERDYGAAAEQLGLIGAPTLHECGYTGAGVTVAVQDGGFLLLHEALDEVDVVAQHDFINDDDNTQNQGGDPPGQHNHGTSVLSLVAGYEEGVFSGVAPGVSVILSKTEDVSQEVPSEEDLWVAGLEWVEGLGADILTTSLGYSLWYDGLEDTDGETAVTSVAAAIAVENGLIVINSAGNEGPGPMTISAPADADGVIAVGATQFDGYIADFSSRGPTYDGRTKPDVAAPGVDVLVADPSNLGGYTRLSGTSFAAPLTAGLVALLLEAYPDYGPAEIYDRLTSTATMADLVNNQYGYGMVDGAAAAPLSCTCHDEDDDGFYDVECGGDDCDDGDEAVNPAAADAPGDGVDQDCDGADDSADAGADGGGGGDGCDCRTVAASGGPGGMLGAFLLLLLAWFGSRR